VLRGERGSGLTGCAYNLVVEGQAIVYPIPRINSVRLEVEQNQLVGVFE
jgi:hypothetical protein